ncbi:MAG: hypothetical protein Q9227_001217 [Pyrenula ochraceoflavens]
MDRLPQEISDLILEFLPKADLKNVRLAQRRFRVHGAAILFDTVTFQARWPTLRNFPDRQHFRLFVKRYRVCNGHIRSLTSWYLRTLDHGFQDTLEVVQDELSIYENAHELEAISNEVDLDPTYSEAFPGSFFQFLLVLASSVEKIDSLKCHGVDASMTKLSTHPEPDFSKLRRLKSLSLHFWICEDAPEKTSLIMMKWLPQILENGKGLSYLSLRVMQHPFSFDLDNWDIKFSDIFRYHQGFPNLRDLELYGFRAEINELKDFLRPCRDSLQTLKLGGFESFHKLKCWKELEGFVREEMPLTQLQLYQYLDGVMI